jgi:hypothetical protein
MPAQPFKVHVDPDALARQDLAATVPLPSVTGSGPAAGTGSGAGSGSRSNSGSGSGSGGGEGEGDEPAAKHGTRDERLTARQRSQRDRSGRASGAGSGRSYAFRRS